MNEWNSFIFWSISWLRINWLPFFMWFIFFVFLFSIFDHLNFVQGQELLNKPSTEAWSHSPFSWLYCVFYWLINEIYLFFRECHDYKLMFMHDLNRIDFMTFLTFFKLLNYKTYLHMYNKMFNYSESINYFLLCMWRVIKTVTQK